jgi:hypothetical protein
METLRSLRHVIARIRKPGSARRAPVATAVRVLATCGVMIPALALVGVGAAEAATVGHTATRSHTASAQSTAVSHTAKVQSTARCKVTRPGVVRPGPRMATSSVKGPWMFTSNATRGPWMWVTSVRGPWMWTSPACATGAKRS